MKRQKSFTGNDIPETIFCIKKKLQPESNQTKALMY